MNKQDLLKIQTCVLRVNLHCEGCADKVKKQLKKVEGVYKVGIDVEQGKVTVSGNVDPSLLIKKLEKSGKHAELVGPQKGQTPLLQSKNIQLDNVKGGKAPKGGFQIPPHIQMQMQQMMNQKKGGKEDTKFIGKDPKSVKFKLPEEEEEDDFYDSDDFDDEEDDFDDESDDDFGGHQPPSKMAPVGHGQKASKGGSIGHGKGDDCDKHGGKGKKSGGGINMLFKGLMGKSGSKKENGGKKQKKGDDKKDDGGKKHGGGDGKNGAAKEKGAAKNGGGKGNDGWSKKGEDFDGGIKLEGKPKGFNEMNAKGGGGGGRNMEMMGQMGGFPAAQGMPAMKGQGNPYSQQQQHMAQMMMMNQQQQQRGNGPDPYNPMAFTRPHPGMGYGPPPGMGYGPPPGMGYGPPPGMGYGPPPGMGYGPPPPAGDNYTHMFNDENTDSCSIM